MTSLAEALGGALGDAANSFADACNYRHDLSPGLKAVCGMMVELLRGVEIVLYYAEEHAGKPVTEAEAAELREVMARLARILPEPPRG